MTSIVADRLCGSIPMITRATPTSSSIRLRLMSARRAALLRAGQTPLEPQPRHGDRQAARQIRATPLYYGWAAASESDPADHLDPAWPGWSRTSIQEVSRDARAPRLRHSARQNRSQVEPATPGRATRQLSGEAASPSSAAADRPTPPKSRARITPRPADPPSLVLGSGRNEPSRSPTLSRESGAEPSRSSRLTQPSR